MATHVEFAPVVKKPEVHAPRAAAKKRTPSLRVARSSSAPFTSPPRSPKGGIATVADDIVTRLGSGERLDRRASPVLRSRDARSVMMAPTTGVQR